MYVSQNGGSFEQPVAELANLLGQAQRTRTTYKLERGGFYVRSKLNLGNRHEETVTKTKPVSMQKKQAIKGQGAWISNKK